MAWSKMTRASGLRFSSSSVLIWARKASSRWTAVAPRRSAVRNSAMRFFLSIERLQGIGAADRRVVAHGQLLKGAQCARRILCGRGRRPPATAERSGPDPAAARAEARSPSRTLPPRVMLEVTGIAALGVDFGGAVALRNGPAGGHFRVGRPACADHQVHQQQTIGIVVRAGPRRPSCASSMARE